MRRAQGRALAPEHPGGAQTRAGRRVVRGPAQRCRGNHVAGSKLGAAPSVTGARGRSRGVRAASAGGPVERYAPRRVRVRARVRAPDAEEADDEGGRG